MIDTERSLTADVTLTDGALEKATRWMFNSGISIADRDNPEYGAVYSHYDGSARRYELIYSEATGYLLSLVKYLTSRREDAGLTALAAASGDWLVAAAGRSGGPISIGRRGGHEIGEAYSFDNGVCCRGLIDLYDLTGARKYLECAQAVAEWILREALMEDGSVRPVLDMRTGRFFEDPTFWFKVSGSFQAKIAMLMFRLGELTGRKIFREAGLRIYGWAVGQQRPDGRFPVNKRSRFVSLHTHCYTIEALLYAYAVEKSDHFLTAAARGVDWMRGVQQADGSAWFWHGGSLSNSKTSYTAAQVVRILSLMHMLNHDEGLMDTAAGAARFLLSMQGADGDQRVHGGFLDGINRSYGVRIRRGHHVLSWGTMFAIQALHLLQEARTGNFDKCVRYLF